MIYQVYITPRLLLFLGSIFIFQSKDKCRYKYIEVTYYLLELNDLVQNLPKEDSLLLR